MKNIIANMPRTMLQIKSLRASADSCSRFISFQCFFNPNNEPSEMFPVKIIVKMFLYLVSFLVQFLVFRYIRIRCQVFR